MKTFLHHFSSRRALAWQREWEFLQQSLAHEPKAAQAWWWKIRLRVLTFVIKRYGADPKVRAWEQATGPREFGCDLVPDEPHTVEPRPRAALSAHLHRIAKENDFPRPPDIGQTRQETGIETVLPAAAVLIVLVIAGFAVGISPSPDALTLVETLLFLIFCSVFWIPLRLFMNLIARWVSRR